MEGITHALKENLCNPCTVRKTTCPIESWKVMIPYAIAQAILSLMEGIRELARVHGLYLAVSYEGWNDDKEAWATIPRKGYGRSGIQVRDERVYAAMKRLEEDAQALFGKYEGQLKGQNRTRRRDLETARDREAFVLACKYLKRLEAIGMDKS